MTSHTGLPGGVFTVSDWVEMLDFVFITYFTIEYLLRLLFAPCRMRYVISVFGVLDLISLVTMYIVTSYQRLDERMKYTSNFLDVINCFQVTSSLFLNSSPYFLTLSEPISLLPHTF